MAEVDMRADKEEIRARNDIVEVIGTCVPLKKRGRNWQGLCPFHKEKTPSFYVDPVTQTFKCFGCSAAGDVFTFVEKYENMTFVEAAEFLARRVGLTFERARTGTGDSTGSERDRLFEMNAVALTFFRTMLERASPAKEYLYQQRGLSHEVIQRFQLGYAPDSWDSLSGYLQARRYDMKIAEAAGLVKQGQTGDYYDVFRHRILFPIHDEQGRIVGFGGRAFGDEQPKYLNTGDTLVFTKSRLLYGLPFARRKIASEKRTLLMEGYMDVIAAHQAGFTNAVATLGTSLTEDHAKRLARLAPTVVLVYDADSAGVKATLRASELLEKEGIEVRVVRLPVGDDPDSILKRGEFDRFQRAIDSAVGRVEYQLERIVTDNDPSTAEGRARMLRQIVAILASVSTRAERDLYIEKVWQHHPMSAHGPSVAKEQLHRDAEAFANRKRGGSTPLPAYLCPPGALPPPAEARPAQPSPSLHSSNWRKDEWKKTSLRYADRDPRYPPGERPRPIEPPPPVAHNLTAEARAERELMRALTEPEWRSLVLQCLTADDLPSPTGRRFFELIRTYGPQLDSEQIDLLSLLARQEEDFSTAVRDRLQEFHTLMANVPITETVIREGVRTLRRHRIKRVKEELAQFLQGKSILTEEDRERVAEYQRILSQLKGSKDSG